MKGSFIHLGWSMEPFIHLANSPYRAYRTLIRGQARRALSGMPDESAATPRMLSMNGAFVHLSLDPLKILVS